MKKIPKSRLGVTLAEMLIALILLSLFTAAGVTVTSAVMASYKRMQDTANAEILASTVIEAITGEIRFGKNVAVDAADSSRLCLEMSAHFGEKATITVDSDGCLVAESEDALTGAVSAKQILSEKTYGGLYLKDLQFEKIGTGTGRTVVTISFSVYGNPNPEALWEGSVSVASMVN